MSPQVTHCTCTLYPVHYTLCSAHYTLHCTLHTAQDRVIHNCRKNCTLQFTALDRNMQHCSAAIRQKRKGLRYKIMESIQQDMQQLLPFDYFAFCIFLFFLHFVFSFCIFHLAFCIFCIVYFVFSTWQQQQLPFDYFAVECFALGLISGAPPPPFSARNKLQPIKNIAKKEILKYITSKSKHCKKGDLAITIFLAGLVLSF